MFANLLTRELSTDTSIFWHVCQCVIVRVKKSQPKKEKNETMKRNPNEVSSQKTKKIVHKERGYIWMHTIPISFVRN